MSVKPGGTDLYVVGGEQRVAYRSRPEWARYSAALVVRAAGGRLERVLEYASPPGHRPAGRPSQVFKAATVAGDTAYLCTQTEVLVCDFPGFAIRRVISHPCFNDLHHVTPGPEGRLYVAVTGLDAVAELDAEGELVRLVNVLGEDPWERFSPVVDYRLLPTTKPHRAHPNYVFFPFADGRPWVTRFEQGDACPLDGDGPRFAIGVARVHDGCVAGGDVLFTTVDGHLVRFDLDGGARRVLDLDVAAIGASGASVASGPSGARAPLGWCRGLLPLAGDRAWVGFTRLRYPGLRRNLSWLHHGFRTAGVHRTRPTRIALYDLAGGERAAFLAEIDLEPVGMGAVFSLHASPEPAGAQSYIPYRNISASCGLRSASRLRSS
ncbi:MAG TPA: hypothetical protein VOA87_04530 [Thermoanaerobaculia bacterium]|nr:hypothetical protein [Thermoanaerobaculia bacterium]